MEVLFTFASWEKYPFRDGYIIINALNKSVAIEEFRRRYPDVTPNTINCADIYTQYNNVERYKLNGNGGVGCHLYIDTFKNIEFVPARLQLTKPNYKLTDLVATYEEYHNIPEAQRMTTYYGDMGQHFEKISYEGFDESVFDQRVKASLDFLGLTQEQFMAKRELNMRNNIKKAFKEKGKETKPKSKSHKEVIK